MMPAGLKQGLDIVIRTNKVAKLRKQKKMTVNFGHPVYNVLFRKMLQIHCRVRLPCHSTHISTPILKVIIIIYYQQHCNWVSNLRERTGRLRPLRWFLRPARPTGSSPSCHESSAQRWATGERLSYGSVRCTPHTPSARSYGCGRWLAAHEYDSEDLKSTQPIPTHPIQFNPIKKSNTNIRNPIASNYIGGAVNWGWFLIGANIHGWKCHRPLVKGGVQVCENLWLYLLRCRHKWRLVSRQQQ